MLRERGVMELRGTRWGVKVNKRKSQVIDNYDKLVNYNQARDLSRRYSNVLKWKRISKAMTRCVYVLTRKTRLNEGQFMKLWQGEWAVHAVCVTKTPPEWSMWQISRIQLGQEEVKYLRII